jgi:hypothetical protein
MKKTKISAKINEPIYDKINPQNYNIIKQSYPFKAKGWREYSGILDIAILQYQKQYGIIEITDSIFWDESKNKIGILTKLVLQQLERKYDIIR